MELKISRDQTIREIQNEFHKAYPFLKMEFFKRSHRAGMPSPKSDLIPVSTPLNTLMNGFEAGAVNIESSKTVAALEEEFRKRFGLNVQVFRKSQSLWIETSLTDHWTLARQNEEGEVFSKPHKPEDLDLSDRDRWE